MSQAMSTDGGMSRFTESDLPDGWVVSKDNPQEVVIIRDDNSRVHITAEPMPDYTDEDGWCAWAIPGFDYVAVEESQETVCEAMIEAAEDWNETGEYDPVIDEPLRERYDLQVGSKLESKSDEEILRESGKIPVSQISGTDQEQETTEQQTLGEW